MKEFQLPLPLFQSVPPSPPSVKPVKVERPATRKNRLERKSAPDRVRRAG